MTNEIIKVTKDEKGKDVVSAKELYDGLGLNRSEWSRWYKRNIEENEFFKENVDWVGFVIAPNRGGKTYSRLCNYIRICQTYCYDDSH